HVGRCGGGGGSCGCVGGGGVILLLLLHVGLIARVNLNRREGEGMWYKHFQLEKRVYNCGGGGMYFITVLVASLETALASSPGAGTTISPSPPPSKALRA
ncbi:unnamed protein product, partial [Ectocarpus sp. 4 AP-2014]